MLSAELRSQIQGACTRFLEAEELKPRYGQRLMIAEVARAFGATKKDEGGYHEGEPAVAAMEVGTGTGKTVVYSLATIVCAKAGGKRLVIATATVALQEQIAHKDLPDLLRNSGLAFSFALAKGRRRYLCLSKLDALLQEGQTQSATTQLFVNDDFNIDVGETSSKLFNQMIEHLTSSRQDGDHDSQPETIDDVHWTQLATDHSQYTSRHCPNFQQCIFYKVCEGMIKVDVTVTNHDLVLADLALDDGAILPDPRGTPYVLDEGHHLPNKAIDHFAYLTRLRATADWLEQIVKNLTRPLTRHPLLGSLGRLIEQVPELAREIKTQQQFMFIVCEEIGDFRVDEDMKDHERPRRCFIGGVVPEHIREMGTELRKGFPKLTNLLTRLTDIPKEAMDDEGAGSIASHQTEEWYPLFGSLLARAQGNWELWIAFTYENPQDSSSVARWLTLTGSDNFYDIEASTSPVFAAETLRRNLWDVTYDVLVTSTTLITLDIFDRYHMRVDLPHNTVTTVMPSPFHHTEAGVLRVPDLRANPRNAAEHIAVTIRELPEPVRGTHGGLIPFSSCKQMQEVSDGLDRDWHKQVPTQGNLSKQEALNKHRSRVDDGEDSVLFDLASFVKGVGLPGAYHEYVVIAKILFAVPDSPMETALAEWIEVHGGNPFTEIAVPDASLRLVQAYERLLHIKQDRGTITLLDRRAVIQRYGKAILNVLPSFQRGIARRADLRGGRQPSRPGRIGKFPAFVHAEMELRETGFTVRLCWYLPLLSGLLAIAAPLTADDTQQVLSGFVKPMAVIGITLEDTDPPSVTTEAIPEGDILRRVTFSPT